MGYHFKSIRGKLLQLSEKADPAKAQYSDA